MISLCIRDYRILKIAPRGRHLKLYNNKRIAWNLTKLFFFKSFFVLIFFFILYKKKINKTLSIRRQLGNREKKI